MTLATVDADGLPNARMVLLKGADERGFVFYNQPGQPKRPGDGSPSQGRLGVPLEVAEPQVRLRGSIERVTDAEADAYFASRPKQAQIGAWASKQSAALESRVAFETAVALYAAKYAVGAVPRPPNWSGFRLLPLRMEFWHDRPFRLHDRIEFTRDSLSAPWNKTRLYP